MPLIVYNSRKNFTLGGTSMLKKLSGRIHRLSKGWVALTALVIFILFTALVLPGQASQASPGSDSAGSPDMSLYYTASGLHRMAEAYGQAGREAYVRARFTFDLVWPLVYMLFLAAGISWLSRKAFDPDSSLQRLNLVPVFALLFDYLENIATSLVMIAYPRPVPVVELLAGPFTLVKWALVTGSFAVLLVAAAVAAWRRVRGRGTQ
jgi:hypothetical protein